MATQAQLEEALRRADAAGNVEDARKFAGALGAMRKAPAVDVGKQTGIAAARVAAPVVAGAQAAIDAAPAYEPLGGSRGLAATMLGGLTLGYGDELAAGTKAGLDYVFSGFDSEAAGRSYDESLAMARGDRRRFADANPVLAPAVEIATGLGTVGAGVTRALAAPANFGVRAGRAAGVGAGYGALAGFGEGEGDLGGRATSAVMGAGIGAGLGPAAEAATTALASVWRSWVRWRGPVRMMDDAGNPTPEGLQMADEAGLDFDQLSPEMLARMDAAAARGAVAGVPGAPAAVQAASLPVEVPLTTGQATNDVNQLMLERSLLRGGGVPSEVMRQFRDDQQAALQANVPALQARMGGGTTVDRGAGAAAAQARLLEMRDAEKAATDAAYREARRLENEARESGSGRPLAPLEIVDDRNPMSPVEESEFARAQNDVRLARARGEMRDKGLIRTIQELGGISLTKTDGTRRDLAGDVEGIFDKRYPPGLINNKKGQSLDYIREALGEMGWFGGRDPQTVTTADLVEMIRDKSPHPNSIGADRRLTQEQDMARSDLAAVGATGRTSADEAAARLAIDRAAPDDGSRLEDLRAGFDAVDDAPFLDDSFQAATGFQGEQAGQLLGRLYSDLRNDGHYLRTLPGVRAEMADLTREVNENGALPIGRAFESLKRFSAVQRNGGQDAVAAGVAKRRIEQEIDQALEQGLLDGDREVIDAFRNARAQYRTYAERFKADDLVGRLVERNPDRRNELRHDPGEVVNYIFGASDLGLIKKGDLARDMVRIRDMLGTDSPAWNGLRQEAFMKIMNRAETQSTTTGRAMSGATIAKAWEDFGRDNARLVETLFTPAERRDIGNFVNVARRATTADTAVYAPSASGFELNRALDKAVKLISFRIPFVERPLQAILEAIRTQTKVNQSRNVTSGRLRPADPPRGSSRRVSDAIIAGQALLGGP